MPQLAPGSERVINPLQMEVTRTSQASGITRTITIQATPDQFAVWRSGQMIQYAFPLLTASEREFLMTGVTAEEWAKMWSDG